MKFLKYIIFVVVLFFTIESIALTSIFQGVIHFTDDPTITLAWSESEGAIDYDVKVAWIDPTMAHEYFIETTTGLQSVIPRPRTGHFKFMVKACNIADDETRQCSEWADSTITTCVAPDPIDNVQRAFIAYWKVPKPIWSLKKIIGGFTNG